ncbi:MAG TPA: apolipoprotein N-acyltransferase [Syntrophales bacterium]|nr:apolipoprotein N-acyltransferase [Syntrophales bacterium]
MTIIQRFYRIRRTDVIYSILGGCLFFLSFPSHGRGFIAWIALVPLFAALRRKNPVDAFVLGFLFGLVAHIGILYWISYVVVVYGSLPMVGGVGAMLLLSAYLALYPGAFSLTLSLFQKRGMPLLWIAPPLWCAAEWIKEWMLTGFPWGNLAYSQYQNLGMIQMADVTGVYGIVFMLVMVNALLFEVLVAGGDLKRVAGECVVCCMLVLCAYGYGVWRTYQVRQAMNAASPVGVTLVQGNIDQNVKWHPDYQGETVDIYRRLSLANAPPAGGLTVWPETAAPFYFQDASDLQRRVTETAREMHSWLLLGSPSYRRDGDETSYRNTAFLLSPDGHLAGRYDKVHLVPYGEYVPLRRFFPFVNKLAVGIGDFRRGDGFHPLSLAGNHRAGVLICYEAIFPEYSRVYKRRGAELLVNITNDAWFGATSAPYQHLSMTVFRAVENRVFFVRAANTGVSAIIDPTGRIAARTGIFESTALKGTARWMNVATPYARYGNIFLYLCLTWVAALSIMAAARKEKIEYE